MPDVLDKGNSGLRPPTAGVGFKLCFAILPFLRATTTIGFSVGLATWPVCP